MSLWPLDDERHLKIRCDENWHQLLEQVCSETRLNKSDLVRVSVVSFAARNLDVEGLPGRVRELLELIEQPGTARSAPRSRGSDGNSH